MRLRLRRWQALSGAGVYRVRSREAVCQTRLGRTAKHSLAVQIAQFAPRAQMFWFPAHQRENCRPKARRVDDLSARMTKGSETDVRPTDSQPVAVSPFRRFALALQLVPIRS